MIYDELRVALLSALAAERPGSANAAIARHLVASARQRSDISVRGVADACGVGPASVSRFCRDVGFEDFDALRRALAAARCDFAVASDDDSLSLRADEHAGIVARSLLLAARSVDERPMAALVRDLMSYERVFACGALKAQAAAVDLQVDLLMLGKVVDTCVAYGEQLDRIARAGADELVVVFSYTGDYFAARDIAGELARIDRPRIWMVCGRPAPPDGRLVLPGFVSGVLTFATDGGQLSHPFQLQMVAALIAQEYARQTSAGADDTCA